MKKYSAYDRVRICGCVSQRKGPLTDIMKEFDICQKTLYNYRKELGGSYAEMIDFYKFIMLELASRGYNSAAYYLRDNAKDILSGSTGIDPPKELDISFPELDEMKEEENNDAIGQQLDAFAFYQSSDEDN